MKLYSSFGSSISSGKKYKPDRYEVARRRMVSEQLIPNGIRDAKVIAAMGRVPRHLFVSHGMEDQAYFDRPVHIGMGQTISQPLMVATMTQALKLSGSERVLEIGTGSGYQTAILAELTSEIYTVERISDLSIRARKTIYKIGYKNINFRIGDGTLGWDDQAPFERIIVTAGAPVVPDELKFQLADGGILLIPVGNEDVQQLLMIIRSGNSFEENKVSRCRFVKLIGKRGW